VPWAIFLFEKCEKMHYYLICVECLKTLLKTQGINLNTEKVRSGQIGQENNGDLLNPKNSLNQQNMCGRRLVWFRTLAFQANDPGFKSRRPHQIFT
jgi:hypothetical protein